MNLQNLITDADHARIREIIKLAPDLKSRWFRMGRDMDKLVKLISELGKPDEIQQAVNGNAKVPELQKQA